MASPEMNELLPPQVFPRLAPGATTDRSIERYRDASGKEFTLLTTRAMTGAAEPAGHILQIAQDISIHLTVLAGARQRLLIVFVVGVAFAAGAGLFVARTSLHPLRHISRTAHDITANRLDTRLHPAAWPHELRECAAAFDAMLDRLQESFCRLAEFSANIAHELRNPLSNLRGATEVALTTARTREEYTQLLESNLEEFERLSSLTERLLFLARADDPRTVIEQVRFGLRREMEAVCEFCDAAAAERGVTVTCDGEAEICGDPLLARRAMSNLVVNALKHTPTGGRVTLAARQADDGTVEIRATDSGCGIPEEHLPKVFERFYQADRAHAANGAGLGLAIVRSIMRLHGGSAAIESTVGIGTTVTLRFPAQLSSQLAQPQERFVRSAGAGLAAATQAKSGRATLAETRRIPDPDVAPVGSIPSVL